MNKRSRGINFSKEEELALANIILKYRRSIESKASDTVTAEEKEKAWNNILNDINCSQRARTLQQIKSKYDNLKTSARKYASSMRENMFKTGGGGRPNESDIVLDKILEILNKKTVFGLHNPYDDDSLPVTQQTVYSDLFAVAAENSTPNLEEIEINVCSDDIIILSQTIENNRKENENPALVNWTKYTPKMLKNKRNPKLNVRNKTTVEKEQMKSLLILKQQYIEQKLQNLKN